MSDNGPARVVPENRGGASEKNVGGNDTRHLGWGTLTTGLSPNAIQAYGASATPTRDVYLVSVLPWLPR
jgi:hypothetical protein